MSLPSDLLDLAGQLARKEPKKPKQATLRRAVSTGYYALFHLPSDACASRLISGVGAHCDELRAYLRRALSHADMKKVCSSASRGTLSPDLAGLFPSVLPPDLVLVASTLVDLQEARHDADYEVSKRFTRREAMDHVDSAASAFDAWKRLVQTNRDTADAFLVTLLLHGRRRG